MNSLFGGRSDRSTGAPLNSPLDGKLVSLFTFLLHFVLLESALLRGWYLGAAGLGKGSDESDGSVGSSGRGASLLTAGDSSFGEELVSESELARAELALEASWPSCFDT